MKTNTLIVAIILGMGLHSGRNTPVLFPDKLRPVEALDTFNYLKTTIIDHKDKYVHHELSRLLRDLSIPVKSYNMDFYLYHQDQIPNIALFFITKDSVSFGFAARQKIYSLIVYFDKPAQADSGIAISRRSKGVWLAEDKSFYDKRILSDIKLTDNSDYFGTKK